MGNINSSIMKHVKDNVWLYFFVILFFAIGLSVGAFTSKALDTDSKQNILIFMNNFFHTIGNENVESKAVFVRAFKNNIQFIIIIWLLCLTYIGVPIVFLVDLFRGFILGFTISFCIQSMGLKGLLFLIIAVVPQNIIYVPCIIVASALAVDYGLSIFKRNVNKVYYHKNNTNLINLSLILAIIFLIMTVASMYEAFVVPTIIKKLSSFLIIQ
ncbi:stage II sporulation protein M [Thermobrachium celere]|uniref:stage II sporulation protein M n=1 Tax=Thermobrachium celere TaxID=53422 RepID=UPI001944B74A|nr:stage II sporulation protein M [Thermobrachium celere]GFR34284.1 stage II sporulation protein M [Thermobrachium celere]